MTLQGAHRLQERFKAKHDRIICAHRDSVEPLFLETGQDLGFLVCLVCGSVYKSRYQPLSPHELTILENLVTEDG